MSSGKVTVIKGKAGEPGRASQEGQIAVIDNSESFWQTTGAEH